MLAASVNYPLRGAVTWKSTVGTNVASDALANLASGGVTGGALIIVGEDYGEGSSIMQERSHAFAMKSQMWLLDPRPNLPSIVDLVETSFELSEATNTPVMLELRVRSCHLYGSFVAKDNVRPDFTPAIAQNNPRRDVNRIVLPPASFQHEREKIAQRLPAALKFIKERRLNEFFGAPAGEAGIIVPGRSVQHADAGAGAAGGRRQFRAHLNPDLCAERDLSAGSGRGDRLLRRQEGGTDGRGRPAGIYRAGAELDPAPRRSANEGHRQGHPADGGRIHRPGVA